MDAVSTCVDCGKALCPNCTEKFSYPVCDSCTLGRIGNDKNLLVRNSIVMIILFIIGFLNGDGFFGSISFGYFLASIPWGWSVLNKITPNIFLFMPLMGWLIYFFIKFALSIMIGMFVTPFKIYQIIKGLKDAKQLELYTKAS